MRRFLPFAALLGVAFVLGCQDVGTGPDGLVPQFDRPVTNNTNCDPPVDGHCHDDAEPPTGDGPHIAVCCSQKEIGRSAARDIASELNGSYSTLKAKRFNEMSPAELAATYDVLIFYWKTSDNVNADWTRLLEYMAAGGGIIYEDPTNLADLAAGVSILGVQGHATEPLSANVRETRSTQRIRVGRRQRKRTCRDCEREWKRMVMPLEPGRPSEARQLLRTRRW